jgi:alpha-aminoadipate carrier protein LysW
LGAGDGAEVLRGLLTTSQMAFKQFSQCCFLWGQDGSYLPAVREVTLKINPDSTLVEASQEIVVEVIMIPCPECKNDFDVEEAELDEGDILSCMECGNDFEVVSFDPLELKKVNDEDAAEGGVDDLDE